MEHSHKQRSGFHYFYLLSTLLTISADAKPAQIRIAMHLAYKHNPRKLDYWQAVAGLKLYDTI